MRGKWNEGDRGKRRIGKEKIDEREGKGRGGVERVREGIRGEEREGR